MRWRFPAALGLAAFGSLTGCGNDAAGPECTRTCPEGETCQLAASCQGAVECRYSQVCVESCENNADCPRGHACEAGVCSPYCQDCPDGQACSTALGTCIGTACTDASCPSGSYCDATQDGCYKRNGSCATDPCRRVPTLGKGLFTISCGTDALCHAESRSVPRPADLDVAETVHILAPLSGDVVAQDALTLHWRRRPNPVILLVGTDPPVSMSALSESAIWGDAREAGVVETTWSRGVSVHAGRWGGAPSKAPTGTLLYLLIQEVSEGELVGTSETVTFSVDKPAWLEDGASCQDEGQAPGDCEHPTQPRICSEGACRRICESDADCTDVRCGLPQPSSDLRACGAN